MTFGTRVEKIPVILIDPASIKRCRDGVTKKRSRENAKLRTVTDPEKRSDIAWNVSRLGIIRDELNDLLSKL